MLWGFPFTIPLCLLAKTVLKSIFKMHRLDICVLDMYDDIKWYKDKHTVHNMHSTFATDSFVCLMFCVEYFAKHVLLNIYTAWSSFRCQAFKHPCEFPRWNQAVRLWSERTAHRLHGQLLRGNPLLHVGEFTRTHYPSASSTLAVTKCHI